MTQQRLRDRQQLLGRLQTRGALLAGGGVRGGQVVGESDATGAVPRLRPVTPADIHATVFAAPGVTTPNA
jgi:hypothetical protein